MKSSTLRPGLLVSLKTSVRGNVSYVKKDIDTSKTKATWETTRTIADPEEHEAATKVRSQIRSKITGVCAASAFGLLCPETDADDLEHAITEARKLADDFNETAKLSRIYVYVITGRIAPDDQEAVRAINAEIRELLEDMEAGVKNLDAKAIRDAANRAREVGAMLSPVASATVKAAIEAARGAARKITAAGEQAAVEVDLKAVRQIVESRTAFLDLDEAQAVEAPQETGRALDLSPSDGEGTRDVKASAPVLEF
jgi:hypothetical protein